MHDVCGTCMHDVCVCGELVCMMRLGDLYAQCVWGTCMHYVCEGLVCMMCVGLVCLMCAHQMCVVRSKLLCVCKHSVIILFLRTRCMSACMLCECVQACKDGLRCGACVLCANVCGLSGACCVCCLCVGDLYA